MALLRHLGFVAVVTLVTFTPSAIQQYLLGTVGVPSIVLGLLLIFGGLCIIDATLTYILRLKKR